MYSTTVTTQQEEQLPRKQINLAAHEPTPVPHQEYKQPMIWFNAFGLAVLYAIACHSLVFRYHEAKGWTWFFHIAFIFISGVGVTAGAHRLWAHRSYSAKLPLRIMLGIMFCMNGQTHMYKWIRDHRTHHKFTETDADPHNANRGFFFSHMGWLMMKRHPAVIEYGKKIDMSDIEADPVIRFIDRHYDTYMSICCFIIPTLVPYYCWGETFERSVLANITRYVFMLNATFCVNSFAHMSGNKPYNKAFKAVENSLVSFFALGEGWHNYHHAFPWDYKTSELPGYVFNFTTMFIHAMAWLGLAYDLKTPSKEVIEKVSLNKGDGTASKYGIDYHALHKQKLLKETKVE